MTRALLLPTFAMVALIISVWFWLLVSRMRHIRRNPPDDQTFATVTSSLDYFRPVELPAQNLTNLFEVPVLFFAIVPLLVITHDVSRGQVFLAWLFVAARVLHSFVHIVIRNVRIRAPLYWLGCGSVFAMWIGFVADVFARG